MRCSLSAFVKRKQIIIIKKPSKWPLWKGHRVAKNFPLWLQLLCSPRIIINKIAEDYGARVPTHLEGARLKSSLPELSFLWIAEDWIRGSLQLYHCEILFCGCRNKRQGSCCNPVCLPPSPAARRESKLLQELQSQDVHLLNFCHMTQLWDCNLDGKKRCQLLPKTQPAKGNSLELEARKSQTPFYSSF